MLISFIIINCIFIQFIKLIILRCKNCKNYNSQFLKEVQLNLIGKLNKLLH